jgi:UDP-2,4-diacetamido-2,4,6-trideoxy-beta-L-altropyranose hydrolase
MMSVLIRVDASMLLGSGHVMRCLALAGELKTRGHRVVFVMRPLPGHLISEVRAADFEVFSLPALHSFEAQSQAEWITLAQSPGAQLNDALETSALLPERLWDWVIVDHYALGVPWQQAMSSIARKLLAVDDQAERPLQCDALLNQNPGAKAAQYAGLLAPGCKLLLGPQYALLRPEFSESRPRNRDRINVSGTSRVLVSLGAADVHGVTLRVLSALENCGFRGQEVTVVAGAQNPHARELLERCQVLNYAYLPSTDAMAQLMVQSDWAIGAGGVGMLERCAMGLPSIVLTIAPNQQSGVASAQALGAVVALNPQSGSFAEQLPQAIQQLMSEPKRLQAMALAALQVCDGRGAVRVANALQTNALVLRAAALEDATVLHEWRNAPQSRLHSGDGLSIDLGQHQQWLRTVLADPDRRLWIASTVSGPVGVLRFDADLTGALTAAEISVYRVPGQPGRGWGKALITRGIQEAQRTWPSLQKVNARISEDNLASLKAFMACGFEASATVGLYQKNLERPPS